MGAWFSTEESDEDVNMAMKQLEEERKKLEEERRQLERQRLAEERGRLDERARRLREEERRRREEERVRRMNVRRLAEEIRLAERQREEALERKDENLLRILDMRLRVLREEQRTRRLTIRDIRRAQGDVIPRLRGVSPLDPRQPMLPPPIRVRTLNGPWVNIGTVYSQNPNEDTVFMLQGRSIDPPRNLYDYRIIDNVRGIVLPLTKQRGRLRGRPRLSDGDTLRTGVFPSGYQQRASIGHHRSQGPCQRRYRYTGPQAKCG